MAPSADNPTKASAPAATETGPASAPIINDNPMLQSYYHTLESRLGYKLLLGDTRHYGYWERDTWWPFPISRGLRAMEDKMGETLALPRGARVLDAGCGVGHVALRLAQTRGFRILAFDVVEHHLAKAMRNVRRARKAGRLSAGADVELRHMDYHHLETLEDESFDGVYTMETCAHATDPAAVVEGFKRVLRPGGHIAMFEYEHDFLSTYEKKKGSRQAELARDMRTINDYSAMATNAAANPGFYKKLLEDAGFVDVRVRDISYNLLPLTRLFYLLAIIPYYLVRLFGQEKRFVNTIAGVGGYAGYGSWQYNIISARKPGGPLETEKTV